MDVGAPGSELERYQNALKKEDLRREPDRARQLPLNKMSGPENVFIFPKEGASSAARPPHSNNKASNVTENAGLVALGATEDKNREFKASGLYCMEWEQQDLNLTFESLIREVAAFMNAQGGTLLIGVDDDGNAVGLAHEYGVLKGKQNWDAYQRRLAELLDNNIVYWSHI